MQVRVPNSEAREILAAAAAMGKTSSEIMRERMAYGKLVQSYLSAGPSYPVCSEILKSPVYTAAAGSAFFFQAAVDDQNGYENPNNPITTIAVNE